MYPIIRCNIQKKLWNIENEKFLEDVETRRRFVYNKLLLILI